MNPQLLDKSLHQPAEESVVTLHNISWERFKTIAASFDGVRGVKLLYLDGVLEIMSPISRRHEWVKRTLSLLLEAYLREKKIRFYALGGFTLEAPGYASSIPDESYCIGTEKDMPDILIEVIVTSGTINRRELYKPLAIPEIWFWKADQLMVYCLNAGEYESVSRSHLLPDLDLGLLLTYVGYADQYDAVEAFRKAV